MKILREPSLLFTNVYFFKNDNSYFSVTGTRCFVRKIVTPKYLVILISKVTARQNELLFAIQPRWSCFILFIY